MPRTVVPSAPVSLPAEFSEALAQAADRLGPIGQPLFWYAVLPSTNDLAASLAERGADEGCVVVADAQSAGRGRLGRTWVSPPGAGIYASVVLRPADTIAGLVTIAAGVAIAEGVEAATGLAADVKWPNDVYVGGRKLAGILAEGGATAGRRSHVVLGFGINVMPAAYPPEVAGRATSIEAELGRPVDRGLVLAECLARLAARYGDLQAGRAADILAAWRARAAATFGRRVEWDADGATQRGIAHDIAEDGALMVRGDAGLERIISGEVRWI